MSGIKRTTADKWFSLYCRARDNWTCQRCGKIFREYIKGGNNTHLRGLDCAHLHGRGAKMTRFEPDNACALCYGCHSYLDANPEEKRDFFIERIGKTRYDELTKLHHVPFRGFKKEQPKIAKKFKEKFENICGVGSPD